MKQSSFFLSILSFVFCLFFFQNTQAQTPVFPDSLCGTWQLDSIKIEGRAAISATQLGGEVSMRFLSNGMLIIRRYDTQDAFHTCLFTGQKLILNEDKKEMDVVSLNRKFLVFKGKEDGLTIISVYRRK